MPKEYKNVIYLADYRKKPVTYKIDTGPEMLSPVDVEELVRQGRWMGTYTPQAPYGPQKEDDKDDDR